MATNGKVAALIGMLFLCGCMIGGTPAGIGPAQTPGRQTPRRQTTFHRQARGGKRPAKPPAKNTAKPDVESTPEQVAAAADAAVRKRLAAKLNKIEFDDIEFKDVIQFIRDVSGLSIHVKWGALSLAGIDKTTPVNVHLNDVTLEKAMRVILGDIGGGATKLEFEVDGGVVTISTAEDLSRHTETRTYPAGDLVHQIWQGANPDIAPWKRDPFCLGKQLRRTAIYPQTQPAAGDGRLSFAPPVSYSYAPVSREEAWAELSGLITELVDPITWRKSGGEVGAIRAIDNDLVITQTRKNHEVVEALLAQLRSASQRTLPLGLAIVRLDDAENLDALRQAAAQSQDLAKDLREGERGEKWSIQQCEVEHARLGRPTVIRRLEQTLLEGACGKDQPPATITWGYEAGILPLREEKGVLAVSLACSAGWIVPAPKDGPARPPALGSSRRVFESTIPATGATIAQVAPLDAEGGGVFLVIWRAGK